MGLVLRAMECRINASLCANILLEFSKHDADSVVAAGAIQCLLKLLQSNGSNPAKETTHAIRTFCVLAKDLKYQEQLVAAGVVNALAHVLKEGSSYQRYCACIGLFRVIRGFESVGIQARAEFTTWAGTITGCVDRFL